MAETLTKIFISGYPQETDEMGLAQLVSPYGQISTIKIVRDKISRKPKGYAFIEMTTSEAAENVVIALDGLEMKEKTLTVNIVEEKPVTPAATYKKVERQPGLERKKRPRLSK
jgi:RNA recognition motif-containing protein